MVLYSLKITIQNFIPMPDNYKPNIIFLKMDTFLKKKGGGGGGVLKRNTIESPLKTRKFTFFRIFSFGILLSIFPNVTFSRANTKSKNKPSHGLLVHGFP